MIAYPAQNYIVVTESEYPASPNMVSSKAYRVWWERTYAEIKPEAVEYSRHFHLSFHCQTESAKNCECNTVLCCQEQEADSIETALMDAVELSDCQSRQLQQLIDTSRTHNTALRQLFSPADTPTVNDCHVSVDVCDTLLSIGELCHISTWLLGSGCTSAGYL